MIAANTFPSLRFDFGSACAHRWKLRLVCSNGELRSLLDRTSTPECEDNRIGPLLIDDSAGLSHRCESARCVQRALAQTTDANDTPLADGLFSGQCGPDFEMVGGYHAQEPFQQARMNGEFRFFNQQET